MAIELTTKYADKVDERYAPISISGFGTNQNYDWDGSKTIKVTSVGTTAMKDYDRTKGYGAVADADDLSNTIQTMTLTKDRFFRFKLDVMDENESKIKAGEALARELREITIPEIEVYRFLAMGKVIKANTATNEIVGVAGKAYENFLKANEVLDDNLVPDANKVAYCTSAFLNELKLNPNFVKASDMAQNMLIKGQIGEVDGVPIVKVAKKTWLANTTAGTQAYNCIIVDKMATVAPIKLQKYRIFEHDDFDGMVGQGRFYYDAFVLNNKKLGLVGVKMP